MGGGTARRWPAGSLRHFARRAQLVEHLYARAPLIRLVVARYDTNYDGVNVFSLTVTVRRRVSQSRRT